MSASDSQEAFPAFEGWRLCGHCRGHGTCHTGRDGSSCFVCASDAQVPDLNSTHHGLPCSVCHGHGCGAPKEVKTNRLMNVYVTVFFSVAVFGVLILSFWFPAHFDKVLTFSGTIIGSITGFYFAGRQRSAKSGD